MNTQRKNKLGMSGRLVITVLLALIFGAVVAGSSRSLAAEQAQTTSPARAGVVNAAAPSADTYVVDRNDDTNVTGCTLAPNDCTLRGAINNANSSANSSANADTISFNIPGNGVHTINLLSDLPTISWPVTIDGYTQPGASCNTSPNATNAALKIVLAHGNHGLTLAGGNSTVRGLVLQNFGTAIYVGNVGNTITGNFIGTDALGSATAHNTYGIQIMRSGNTVGGTNLCDRNLLSGNTYGVFLQGSAVTNNAIINNLIGTNAAGTASMPRVSSYDTGVRIDEATNTTIGGTIAGSGNLISGNVVGIYILPSAGPNWIHGNWIGVDSAHTGPLGNTIGVWLVEASNTHVGGASDTEANVIANSIRSNVIVTEHTGPQRSGAIGNAILRNSIYGARDGMGIELGGNDVVTPNDPGDADAGPNFLQNFPVLTSVTDGTIEGTLNSTDNTSFAIEFFASPTCNQYSHGEGQMYLGTWTGTTSGHNLGFSFSGSVPPAGWFITATATDLSNNSTSEFSRCLQEGHQSQSYDGAISGRAYLRSLNGQVAANARVYACIPGYCSLSVLTDANGDYLLTDLPPGTYQVSANPPGGSLLLTDRLSGITVNDSPVPGQDLVFRDPNPPPPGVSIQPSTENGSGLPTVYSAEELTLRANGCAGGSATYEIRQNNQVIRSGTLAENPSGTYVGNVAPFYEQHGLIYITIVITCPDQSTDTIDFNVYIDPSGVVQSFLPDGTPAALPMATVVLSRSDSSGGPFDVVPDQSALMSPGNRTNPDVTRLNGHFGWDVVPGFYKVRASKANCAKPGDLSQPYVDTYVMEIPPPVTDLVLQLDCGKPTFTDVHEGDFFYNGATYLAAISVLGGYGDAARCPTGTPCFLPGNNVTRGQAAKIIGNAAGLADDIPATQQTFQDVDPTTNPFWLYIERMVKHGYARGYPCGGPGEQCMPGNRPYFRWNNQITRSQLTKILVLANQYVTIAPASAHFEDVPTTDPFYTYVETAYQEGLMGGYMCGGPGEECMPGNRPYFRGGANATRGQLSKMVTFSLVSP